MKERKKSQNRSGQEKNKSYGKNVQDRKKLSKSCEAMILIGIEKSHYTDINDLLNLLENSC